jgi:hypothetical protein
MRAPCPRSEGSTKQSSQEQGLEGLTRSLGTRNGGSHSLRLPCTNLQTSKALWPSQISWRQWQPSSPLTRRADNCLRCTRTKSLRQTISLLRNTEESSLPWRIRAHFVQTLGLRQASLPHSESARTIKR